MAPCGAGVGGQPQLCAQMLEGQPLALRWVLGRSLGGIFIPFDINVILRSSSAYRTHHPLGCGPSHFVVDHTGHGRVEQAVSVLRLLVIADSA